MPNTALNSLSNSSSKPLSKQNYLPVAIAVICRGSNVLISKRAEDVHLGGLWEFPGGKIEQGETEIQALHRELHEELGISIAQAEPLISIPCFYPELNVLLNVWMVSKFTGRASGKEKQKIMWVSQSQLAQVDFPKINKHIINALLLPKKYVITEDIDLSKEANKKQFIEQFKIKCKQYYRLIQLRFKSSNLDSYEFNDLIQQLLYIANGSQVQLQVNSSHLTLLNSSEPEANSPELKANSPFLGIHLTSHDLSHYDVEAIGQLRKQYPSLISASCHCLDDVLKANDLNVDFIVLSPVNKTRSHPQAQVLGWDSFKALTAQSQMPVYALGGMDLDDMEQAKEYGAQGIAGISCFVES